MIIVGERLVGADGALTRLTFLEVHDGIAKVIGDSAAGSFKESEHPRDNSGKFSTSGGGGGHAGALVPAPMTNHLKKIVGAAGFKKAKGAGPTTYVHPSGVKIIVHPTPGKIHSSKWSVQKPGGEQASGEGTSLNKVLAKLVPKTEAPKPKLPTIAEMQAAQAPAPSLVPPAASASKAEVKLAITGKGFKSIGSYEDDGEYYELFEKLDNDEDSEIKYFTSNGSWLLENASGIEEGTGLTHLMALLNGEEPETQAAVEHVEKQAAAAFSLKEMANTGSGKAITALGYEPAETEAGTTVYTKPNGAKIKYSSTTTEWVVVTPGHMTKEGEGLPALEALMKGKIEPGVKNSSQTIQTKAEASAQTEAQKAAQAKAEAGAQKTAAQSKLMKTLQAVAPQPTASQQAAIASYSGSNYTTINTALRHDPKTADTDNKVKDLDSYLANSTIPEACTLYRKVSGEYAKILKSVMMEGCSFIDRGFISTSTHEGTWTGSLQMIIDVPAGSKGAAIKSFSQHKNENEVLLPRNSKLIVTSMDYETGIINVTVDQGHLK